jgi:hypothetical protein
MFASILPVLIMAFQESEVMNKRNIIFICHHNNDFDHFLPLIIKFKNDEQINVKNITFYHKGELLQNKLHRYICEENKIEIDSISEIFYLRILNKAIVKIHTYLLENYKPNSRWPLLRFFKLLLEKYFAVCAIFLLTSKKIEEYIESNEFDIAIIDHRSIEETKIEKNPMERFILLFKERSQGSLDNLIFRFAKKCRDKNIPIFMMPHGPQPIIKKTSYKQFNETKKTFRPDFLVLGNKNELRMQSSINGLKSTLFLGDPRFDIEWINYLELCTKKVYKKLIKKPNDKTVLLYLMDIYKYSSENNENFKSEVNREILSLVNIFPNLEIWVKHHPRKVFQIPTDEIINKDRQKNIKQFGNDTDTNALIANADICLALSTTTFILPILQKKPVIFYDTWKEKLQDATSIYDDLRFKASSQEELIIQYKKIINGEYEIDDSFLKSFYKNVFSVHSLSESMSEKYYKKIKQILELC